MAVANLEGREFGRLQVVKFLRLDNHRKAVWECRCSCGATTEATTGALKSGKKQSCGCLHKELLSKRVSKDYTGKRFGKLVIVKRLPNPNGNTHYDCKCDCGNFVRVSQANLVSGDVRSCGCLRAEYKSTLNPKWVAHIQALRVARGNAPDEPLSSMNAALRGDIEKFRRAVFERDGYKCQICGEGGYVNAHHVFPVTEAPELAEEVRYGITLCARKTGESIAARGITCHDLAHPDGFKFGEACPKFQERCLEVLAKKYGESNANVE